MGYGEYDTDIDRVLRTGGRRFVAREGRNEFLRPTYGSDGDGDGDRPPRLTRSLALKIALMAILMIGVLVAIMAIFT